MRVHLLSRHQSAHVYPDLWPVSTASYSAIVKRNGCIWILTVLLRREYSFPRQAWWKCMASYLKESNTGGVVYWHKSKSHSHTSVCMAFWGPYYWYIYIPLLDRTSFPLVFAFLNTGMLICVTILPSFYPLISPRREKSIFWITI
jgi:hypothetical protein